MKIRLLVLSSLALLSCAEAPTQVPGPGAGDPLPIQIEAVTVLRAGSNTTLAVDPSPDDATSSYAWRSTGGRISGEGSTVLFTAPEDADSVRVNVEVKEKDGTTWAGATTIIVFRQWVILKADDFRYAPAGTISPGWRRFIDFVEERKIRTSIGLIGIEIERGDSAFAAMIHHLASNPRFEFWNHGYDHLLNVTDEAGHTVSEFRGTSYEHQLEHMQRTQTLARDRCGIVLHAFGAPGNAFDSNTARAIDACDDLRIWFFGAPYSDRLVLPYTVAIEQPIFQPNESGFMTAYDPAPPCVTYQIHPKDWDPARFDAFTRIIDFLIAQDVTFTTPSDFERISHQMAGGR